MKPLSKNKWDKNEYDLWKPTEKCLKWSICTWIFVVIAFSTTAWKVSKLGVFLVHIFLHLDWVLRDSCYLSVFCRNDQIRIRIRKTPKWEYGHFSRSLCFDFCFCSLLSQTTSLYCNNIESHAEKNEKYCLGCEALLIDRVFDNIFWQYFR